MASFMQTRRLLFLSFFLWIFGSYAKAQDHKLQTLAQLYSQGYYKMVYRKASRLLANPTYDYSKDPAKYKQLAAIELAKNPKWAKRHSGEYLSMEKSNEAPPQPSKQGNFQAQQLLQEAQKYIGVPYKMAGIDPNGFDCSGFTCYLFEKKGIELPRRATDQYEYCQPISAQEATAGDLVFFSNGGEVNHVGILVSSNGAPKQMIHASSSIGVSIADIETSPYWSKRVVGYGRVTKK
jgi:cell wall-associated NlpC family hydrolase